MKISNYLFCALLLFQGQLFGQDIKVSPSKNLLTYPNAAKKSQLIEATLHHDLVLDEHAEKWAISVRPTFSRKHSIPEIQAMKELKYEEKMKSYRPNEFVEVKSQVSTPIINQSYEANWSLAAAPPDNTMAVSNGGMVVTCNNDGAEFYNSAGNLLYSNFWYDFFGDPNYTAMLYDPKIIYDSQADRFILIVLHGSNSSTSQVIISFSKSNNPLDGWWVYNLTGNPVGANNWFDYPHVGVSNDEVFITGNLFSNANVFSQAVVYQIPKTPGYSGNNFNWQYWSDLDLNFGTPFTLVPATNGHQGNYGPGLYFISTIPGGATNSILWDLTSNIGGNPQLDSYSINSGAYSPAADANQQGSTESLSNGDNRTMGAFFLNGMIHYVFHADIGSGWNGIKYNRLNLTSGANVSSSLGQAGSFDLSYPALASFATSTTDKSVMIAFLRSSQSIFAEVRVVNCDDNMNWSGSVLVKSGESVINFLEGNERWGDYTGMCRRHNSSTPKVWLAGCYGADIVQAGVSDTYKTWVAEISGQAQTSGVEEHQEMDKFAIFPMPVYDLINISFETVDKTPITIEIVDLEGKLVKLLYKDTPKVGVNKLVFNKDALSSGTYFVHIYSPSQTLKNEKIIILE